MLSFVNPIAAFSDRKSLKDFPSAVLSQRYKLRRERDYGGKEKRQVWD
jgi:hypothetical protein